MAPIKYEEQMKDKLEKRSLQPSPESWATLANRLDAEQKDSNRSFFWWIGIAASVVGILFVTTMYFNNQPIDNDPQIVVETKENVIPEDQQKDTNKIIEAPVLSNAVVAEETKFVEKSVNESVSNSNETTRTNEKNASIEKSPQQNAVGQLQQNIIQKSDNLNTVDKLTKIKSSELTFENQKVQDVIAQINILKANGNSVTDSEIDNLLKKAQNEILSNRLYNENTRTVDANALLQDVEEDLQQSFRSKVFEALQSGYESVKTAVAERNN